MSSPHLSPREKAAVQWAEHVTKNTARRRDDVYEEVARNFSQPEIVELTLICGMFNLLNRFMDSLRIPVEPMGEVNKIKRSVYLDPGKVQRYFRNTAEKWPETFPNPGDETKPGGGQ